MMKYFLVPFLTFFFYSATGQEISRCLTDSVMQKVYDENPEYKKNMEEGFRQLHVLRSKQKTLRRDEEIVIPVHFIIVHPPGEEVGEGVNHSIARILSQLEVINQDFGRTNPDAHLTPSVFPVGDTGIRFCLAAMDPNGNPTTGITRYATDLNFRQNELMIKTATRWPREDYLNIWVAELGDFLGFAYIPTTTTLPNQNLDGVMIRHNVFGGPGYGQPPRFNRGRTGTHEIGHYLGLRHIWAGGCTADDGIDDTPIQEKENFHCPTHPSPSCNNGGDMFMNYMDYVDDGCMNAFTIGQGDYMHLILNTVRSSLLESAQFRCIEELPLELIVNDLNPINCHDDEGAIVSLKANGGRAPYRFFLGNQSNTHGMFTDLQAGEYEFIVEDVLERRDTLAMVVTRPDELELNISNISDNLCFGGNDGSVLLTGNGGRGAYEFSLEGALFATNTTGFFTNLPSGEYTALIVDSLWCEKRIQFAISSPSEVEIQIPLKMDPPCFDAGGGSMQVLATGGVAPYKFIFNGDTSQFNVFTDISAGVYLLMIEDANGCLVSRFIEFSEPDEIIPEITREVRPGCSGPRDGILALTATGGNPPYLFSLDGVNFQPESDFDGLAAGDYTMKIRDSHQCEVQFLHSLIAKENPEYSIILGTEIACHGDSTGFIEIIIPDDDGKFIIELDGSVSESGFFDGLTSGYYLLKITDRDGCYTEEILILEDNSPLEFQFSAIREPRCSDSNDGSVNLISDISGLHFSINGQDIGNQTEITELSGGIYLVVASDGGECPSARTLILNTPSPLRIDWILTDVSCHSRDDAELRLRASGGTSGEFLWRLDDGEFMLGGRQILMRNLSPGMYRITLKDHHYCQTVLEINIEEPSPLNTGYTLLSPDDCLSDEYSGSFSVFAFGGTPPFRYEILGLETDLGLFTGFQAGIYMMQVRDMRDCSVELTVQIPMENGFNVESIEIEDVSCFGLNDGKVSFHINPQGEYRFQLLVPELTDVGLHNLPPGDFIFLISDIESSCEQLVSFGVDEPQLLSLQLTDIQYLTDLNIYKITAEATGGTPPYTYSLNVTGPFFDTAAFEVEQAGDYKIYVFDANGCSDDIDFLISRTDNPEISDGLLVYPNPAQNIMYIKGAFIENGEKQILITDVTGRNMTKLIAQSAYDRQVIELDIQHLPGGIYFLHIITSDNIKSTNFVKVSR